jgi:hypothetical protein
MSKVIKLPKKVNEYLSALKSGPTLSLIKFPLDIQNRPNNGPQWFANIIGGDRKEWTAEYFDKNKKGEDIIKSDLFERIGKDYYKQKSKRGYPHHHISKPKKMNDRLNSVLKIADDK